MSDHFATLQTKGLILGSLASMEGYKKGSERNIMTMLKTISNIFLESHEQQFYYDSSEKNLMRMVSLGLSSIQRTAQKMMFCIKDFFSICDPICVSCGFGHIIRKNVYW